MPVRVESEIGRLRRVVVHSPGNALARMLPDHILPQSDDYLLFDDLLDVDTAKQEHQQLVSVLETCAEVGHFEGMLREVFEASPEGRQEAIDGVARLERLGRAEIDFLVDLPPDMLAEVLIVGTSDGSVHGRPLFAPIPNLIFTRDLLAVVGTTLFVGQASKRARKRESVLTRAMVAHHPWFRGSPFSRHTQRIRRRLDAQPLSIEGGDLLVLSPTQVLIGSSERTSWSASLQLAQEFFGMGVEKVLVVDMPKRRSAMHLDTVFTQISAHEAVVYRPLTDRQSPDVAHVTLLSPLENGGIEARDHGCLVEALRWAEIDCRPIFCGNGHPVYEVREQWTDGANFFALAPGIIVGYERNHYTAKALDAAGYEVLTAASYLRLLYDTFRGDFDSLLESKRKLAIHISGSELCRGRGGPRCLTMPLIRECGATRADAV